MSRCDGRKDCRYFLDMSQCVSFCRIYIYIYIYMIPPRNLEQSDILFVIFEMSELLDEFEALFDDL